MSGTQRERELVEDLRIANERGDAWRDKYNADTEVIAQLKAQVALHERIVESTYGQWTTVSRQMLDDPPARQFVQDQLGAKLLAWCSDNFLRVVGPIQFTTGIQNESMTLSEWYVPGLMLLMAQCRAQGLPPEQRLPLTWWQRRKQRRNR